MLDAMVTRLTYIHRNGFPVNKQQIVYTSSDNDEFTSAVHHPTCKCLTCTSFMSDCYFTLISKALSTLSQKSETVSQKWDCRRKVGLSPNSATVALFCNSLTFVRQSHFSATVESHFSGDSLTFLRQCGQGFIIASTWEDVAMPAGPIEI